MIAQTLIHLSLGLAALVSSSPVAVEDAAFNNQSIAERELFPCYGCTAGCGYWEKSGDDNYYTQYTQVTDPVSCGGGSCTAAYTTSETIGWSFDAGAGGGGDPGFGDISGTFGFSISESHTTGETSSGTCNQGQTACIVWAQDRVTHPVQFKCNQARGCSDAQCSGTADVLVNNDAGNPQGCYVTLCDGCAGKGEIITNPSATCAPQ